jgi:hypothetical protein
MRMQKPLHLGAQQRVAAASLVQKNRPLLRGVRVNGSQKDRLGRVGLLAHDLRSYGTNSLYLPMRIWSVLFLTSSEGKSD